MPALIPPSLAVDNVTLQQSALGVVSVKDGGISEAKLAADVRAPFPALSKSYVGSVAAAATNYWLRPDGTLTTTLAHARISVNRAATLKRLFVAVWQNQTTEDWTFAIETAAGLSAISATVLEADVGTGNFSSDVADTVAVAAGGWYAIRCTHNGGTARDFGGVVAVEAQ